MKKLFVLTLFLAACGRQTVAHRDSVDVPGTPVEAPGPKSAPTDSAPTESASDFVFEKAALNADLKWDAPITADGPAAFEVQFWKQGDTTRASVAPEIAPKAFFVMKCCKTPTATDLKAVGGGYRAEDVVLFPGEYWLYVQVGDEKTSVDVSVQ